MGEGSDEGLMGGGWPGGAGDARGHRVTTPGTPGPQWLPPGSKESWGKKVRAVLCFHASVYSPFEAKHCTIVYEVYLDTVQLNTFDGGMACTRECNLILGYIPQVV